MKYIYLFSENDWKDFNLEDNIIKQNNKIKRMFINRKVALYFFLVIFLVITIIGVRIMGFRDFFDVKTVLLYMVTIITVLLNFFSSKLLFKWNNKRQDNFHSENIEVEFLDKVINVKKDDEYFSARYGKDINLLNMKKFLVIYDDKDIEITIPKRIFELTNECEDLIKYIESKISSD